MKSLRILSLMVLTVVLPASQAGAPKPDQARKDMETIQGTWTMIFASSASRQLPPEEIANLKLVMKGDKYTLFKVEVKIHDHGAFKLDPTRGPRAIDITEDQGPNKGTTSRGIYMLVGDTFMVCYNSPAEARPTEFSSQPGSSNMIFIYKRTRP